MPIVIGARRLFLECGNGLRPVAMQSATLYHNEKRKTTALSALGFKQPPGPGSARSAGRGRASVDRFDKRWHHAARYENVANKAFAHPWIVPRVALGRPGSGLRGAGAGLGLHGARGRSGRYRFAIGGGGGLPADGGRFRLVPIATASQGPEKASSGPRRGRRGRRGRWGEAGRGARGRNRRLKPGATPGLGRYRADPATPFEAQLNRPFLGRFRLSAFLIRLLNRA